MHAADDLIRQGRAARFEDRREEALGHYQRAAELFKAEEDNPRWAHTMRYVATIEVELKRGKDAQRDIEMVLAQYEVNRPSVLEVASAKRVAALAAEACGEPERAKAIWEDAADLFAEARLLEGHIEKARDMTVHDGEA